MVAVVAVVLGTDFQQIQDLARVQLLHLFFQRASSADGRRLFLASRVFARSATDGRPFASGTLNAALQPAVFVVIVWKNLLGVGGIVVIVRSGVHGLDEGALRSSFRVR